MVMNGKVDDEEKKLHCDYCKLMNGEYFSPRLIGKMKPYCTSWMCER